MTHLLLSLLLLAITPIPTTPVARGPPRSYRSRRTNKDHVVLGGEILAMQKAKRSHETLQRLENAAKKGEEFVFDSKEKVDAVFRCTSCYLSIPHLSSLVVGRLELQEKKSSVAKSKERNDMREKIRAMVRQTCTEDESIHKDPPVLEACAGFVHDNEENLVDLLLLRTDPEDEMFEVDLSSVTVCRDPNEIDEMTCAPGVPSMGDLLAQRFQEEDEKKQEEETRKFQLKREKEKEKEKEEEEEEKRRNRNKVNKKGKKKKRKTKKKKKRVVMKRRRPKTKSAKRYNKYPEGDTESSDSEL